jgi:hypothetical protein
VRTTRERNTYVQKHPPKNTDTGLREGFRSGLEDKVADQLRAQGIDPQYEQFKIEYTKPARKAKYTPDFRLPNGLFIETKGRFITEDRQKHLLIKAQHPEYEIRFVFSNSRARLSKTSKTTYADWCLKHGFRFADKRIPQEWIDE